MRIVMTCCAMVACGGAAKGPSPEPGSSVDTVADADTDTDTDADGDTDTDADGDTSGSTTDTGCVAPGSRCDPFVVDAFPYVDTQNTALGPYSEVDAYGCDLDIDESGPEFWYRVTLPEPGLLQASIDEVADDGVDIDVHLLDAPDPLACLERDHASVSAFLDAGEYWLVLDTWVDGSGVPQQGPYTLTVDFLPQGQVDCAYAPTDVQMYWTSCAVADCFTSGSDVFLSTPTTGPVVKEAHLVTVAESFGGNGWPTSFTDGIANHYAVSEAATGYVMSRSEPWAPSGEGGSEYGQAAHFVPLPVEDESWYINMYWRNRPAAGTRMLVKANGKTVVAAAGYETGPGANTSVAGVAEEVHHYLGTTHLDELEIGFAADATLPLGPIACP